MAGSTSTAVCITFIFAHLCRNQDQIKKLQAEVDSCWDGQVPLEASMLGPAGAPYLQGVIDEALRLWPPAPAGMQRRTPEGGIIVDGQLVPENTLVSVTPMAIQRDERYYSKPNEFIPERWVDSQRPSEFNHEPKAFIPFTVGQFACLGKNLAYQELRMFVGKVVRNFDLAFAPGFDPSDFERAVSYKGTFLLGALPMVFTPRK